MASEVLAKFQEEHKQRIDQICAKYAAQFTAEELATYKALFIQADGDCSGTIDLHELAQLFEKLGEPKSHHELKKIIEDVDTNHDRVIDMEEFLQMMCIDDYSGYDELQGATQKELGLLLKSLHNISPWEKCWKAAKVYSIDQKKAAMTGTAFLATLETVVDECGRSASCADVSGGLLHIIQLMKQIGASARLLADAFEKEFVDPLAEVTGYKKESHKEEDDFKHQAKKNLNAVQKMRKEFLSAKKRVDKAEKKGNAAKISEAQERLAQATEDVENALLTRENYHKASLEQIGGIVRGRLKLVFDSAQLHVQRVAEDIQRISPSLEETMDMWREADFSDFNEDTKLLARKSHNAAAKGMVSDIIRGSPQSDGAKRPPVRRRTIDDIHFTSVRSMSDRFQMIADANEGVQKRRRESMDSADTPPGTFPAKPPLAQAPSPSPSMDGGGGSHVDMSPPSSPTMSTGDAAAVSPPTSKESPIVPGDVEQPLKEEVPGRPGNLRMSSDLETSGISALGSDVSVAVLSEERSEDDDVALAGLGTSFLLARVLDARVPDSPTPDLCALLEDEDEGDDNVYVPDTHTKFNFEGVVTAISMKLLIGKITHPFADEEELTHVVLTTWSNFTSAPMLLDGLIKRFWAAPAGPLPAFAEHRKVIQRKVLQFLNELLVLEPSTSFCPTSTEMLDDFCAKISQAKGVHEDEKHMAEELGKVLKDETLHHAGSGMIEGPISIIPAGASLKHLGQIHPLEVARQITLVDFEPFSAIGHRELLKQAWCKGSSAPNVLASIDRFNATVNWAGAEILKWDSEESKAIAICMLLDVANNCAVLQNYAAVFAIVTSLQSPAVSRLSWTWDVVPSKYMEEFDNLKEFASMSHNYHNYRAKCKKFTPPMIPYLGVHLQDLTFIDDGNPRMVGPDKKLINIEKQRLTADVVDNLLLMSTIPYTLRPVPAIVEYLEAEARRCDAKKLYQLSLKQQPRGEKRKKKAKKRVEYTPLPGSERPKFEVRGNHSFIDEVLHVMSPRYFNAGSPIVEIGQPGNQMYFISSGVCRVLLESGREFFMNQGEFFGEIALFLDRPRSASVFAHTDVQTLSLSRRLCAEVMKLYPDMQKSFQKLAEARLKTPNDPPPPPKWMKKLAECSTSM